MEDLGIDVDNGFEPVYVVNADKRQQVAKLKAALKNADELLLATDEDREGEAIAWHLLEVLSRGARAPDGLPRDHPVRDPGGGRQSPRHRPGAGRCAGDPPHRRPAVRLRDLAGVVEKVMPRLSAGRVQSVATRLLVERERARIRFRSAEYWDLEATFDTGVPPQAPGDPTSFEATLVALDGKRIEARQIGSQSRRQRDGAAVR